MAEPSAAAAASDKALPADVGDLLVNNGAPDNDGAAADPPEDLAAKNAALQERLRIQSDMIARRDREVGEVTARLKDQDGKLTELLDRQRNAEHRGYSRAESEIRALMKGAVAEADTAKYERLEAELEQLHKIRPTAPAREAKKDDPPPQQQAIPPEFQKFQRDNPWFGKDIAMSSYAQGAEMEIMQESPHLTMAERLEETRKRVLDRFPEKFENKARKAAAAVAQPGAQPARKPADPKKKTVADLDYDTRQTLAKLKRLNPRLTDEAYLAEYFKDDKA